MGVSKQESIVRTGQRRGDAVLKLVLSPCGPPGGPAVRLVEVGLKPELMEEELRRLDAVLKNVLRPCGPPGGPAARLVEAGLKPELMEGELRGGNAIQTSVKVEVRIYFSV